MTKNVFNYQAYNIFYNLVLLLFFFVLLSFVKISPEVSLLKGEEFFRLLICMVIFFSVVFFGKFKVPSVYSSLSMLSLSFLFAWALITSINGGEYLLISVRRALLALGVSLILLYSLYCIKFKFRHFNNIINLVLLFSTIISIFGLLFYALGDDHVGSGRGTLYQSLNLFGFEFVQELHRAGWFNRTSSLTPNPNTLGFLSGLACLLLIGKAFLDKRKNSVISVVIFFLFIINALSLTLTFSRASILALVVSSVLLVIIYSRVKFLIYSFVFILIFLFCLPVWFEPVADFFDARADQGLHNRDIIWKNALRVFKENPLAGVGFGLENEKIHEPAGIRWTMHNAYLVVLAETGVIGFLFFTVFVFSGLCGMVKSIITKSKLDKSKDAVILCLVVVIYMLVRSFFETSILRFTSINVFFIFFFAAGISFAERTFNNGDPRK